MARSLRSPAVLMTVYLAVFVYAGPWLATTGNTPHRNVPEIAIGVLLAVLATQGSRAARVLMITYSAAGVFIVLFSSTHWWSTAPSPRLSALVCVLVQIGLLVSSPMFQRTRPGWSPGQFQPGQFPPAQFLPAPRMWTVLVSGGAGLATTLLPFRNLRALPCPATNVRLAPPCLADGSGYPVAYHFDGGILTLHAGNAHWLYVLAPRGIEVAAFAADWAMWSLGVLLVLYLAQLDLSRGYCDPPQRHVAEPGPAGP